MKKMLLVTLFLPANICLSQAYHSMPVDSAVWRYRFYDEDFVTQVTDQILFVTGEDTNYAGHTYHKVFSRIHHVTQSVSDPLPPIESVSADYPDMYYGAYREESRKIYYLSLSSERLIYDFDATIGGAIPAYGGIATVTSIDSILLADGYHRRYNTTESFFSPIEGIGSSSGLLPALVDGSDNLRFHCYTRAAVSYSPPPSTSIPCTIISPFSYYNLVPTSPPNVDDIVLYPVPTTGTLHLLSNRKTPTQIAIFNVLGILMRSTLLNATQEIDVRGWPKGLYWLCIGDTRMNKERRRFIIE